MTEVDLEPYWKEIGHPATTCTKCQKEVNGDGSALLWRCNICGHLVCRECTLTMPELVSFRGMENATEALRRRMGLGPNDPQEIVPEMDSTGKLLLTGGREYLAMTLCSRECWESAGKPEE